MKVFGNPECQCQWPGVVLPARPLTMVTARCRLDSLSRSFLNICSNLRGNVVALCSLPLLTSCVW